MTDEAYTFVKDIRDKKSVAASAFRRNPGHRGCKLPYEAIPYAERRKLNGEVKTMNIDRPMKWDEFKALPDDIKVKYITRLRELYHANYKDIAEMLGTGHKYLNQIANGLGIDCYGQDGKVSRNRMTWQQRESWKAFCNGVLGGSPKAEVQVEEPKMASELLSKLDLDECSEYCKKDVQMTQEAYELLPAVKPAETVSGRISVSVEGARSWDEFIDIFAKLPISAFQTARDLGGAAQLKLTMNGMTVSIEVNGQKEDDD